MGQFFKVLCLDCTNFRPFASPRWAHTDRSNEQMPVKGYDNPTNIQKVNNRNTPYHVTIILGTNSFK